RRCSRSSGRRRRWSRGSPSTRRSSTSAGWGRARGRPPRSPCACGGGSASGSACRSPSGWPGPSSWPRWPAASPSPTACWWCRPTASWTSSTRCPSRGSGGAVVGPPGGELSFLHPRPVERLWGVGPVTADKLRRHGVRSVGQVARLGEPTLVAMVGQASGRHLHALAHNRDPRPVDTGRRRRSIGSQRALGLSPKSPADLDAVVIGLVDRITRRMRTAGRAGRTAVLRLRFDGFARVTRSHTLPWPTSHTPTIMATARDLLVTAMPMIRRQGVTLIGVTVANLDDSGCTHPPLPSDRHSGPSLDAAVDEIRERFGSDAVGRAVLLGRDQGLSVPLLPD